ncbi:hypothetical protein HW555_007834 [Spodoptera exigua]|uniref:Uncharacterized protein n=1 Tax=Spodoptera exigua TaxID=7107 RepID=A0A835L505_SPOEX|nr:hypothetical protein HW555_007834 [Spodoptera exigua]
MSEFKMGDNIKVRYCNLKKKSQSESRPNYNTCKGRSCLTPFLCYERLKNPALNSRIGMEGSYTNASFCAQPDIQQRSNPLSFRIKNKKKSYQIPNLSYHRIKNPEWPIRPMSSNLDFNI